MLKPLSVQDWKRDYCRLRQIASEEESRGVVCTLLTRIQKAGGDPPPHEGDEPPIDVDYATRVYEVYLTVRHNLPENRDDAS